MCERGWQGLCTGITSEGVMLWNGIMRLWDAYELCGHVAEGVVPCMG